MIPQMQSSNKDKFNFNIVDEISDNPINMKKSFQLKHI